MKKQQFMSLFPTLQKHPFRCVKAFTPSPKWTRSARNVTVWSIPCPPFYFLSLHDIPGREQRNLLQQPSYRSPSSGLLSSLRSHGNGIDRSSTRRLPNHDGDPSCR
ncbi:hypothetical protein AVEN_186046-1 [Araneus ventricosus]|uniref:Uncharacterized protein n=1 Tax=Araneus ventricosus TaxID=182803 RepID=A0A4Y2SYF2_ARAVE|nr:hypothetical protein AVEN_90590-1 [Araneus ventricosus]GBN93291.1 hypothetical protein AVEN_198400-1 [Araneus ventricosus]GBO05259.1 hypothetical protein AVEN_209893-1 [Araneus ventricosus]GBO05266.1 hypothetical protein AVEN_186046-1 [Araneus ventricosus]